MRGTAGHRLFDACNYLLMIALSITFLYPLLNVAATSVSSGMRVVAGTIGVIPVNVDLQAYRIAMRNPMLLGGYGNSIFYAGVGTLANLVLISLAAYPLSKRHLVFRGPISFFIAFTLLFSGGLIPTFLLVKTLGLYNTRAWIIATQFYHVFFIVMLRTFYQQLPSSLEDAAKIDGYNDLQIMYRIYMPLSKPILATLALFSIVAYWNDYFNALVYLLDSAKHPLQLVLRDYLIPGESMYATSDIFRLELTRGDFSEISRLEMAAQLRNTVIVLSTMPLVTVMLAVQRYFRRGVLIGALKD